MKNFALLFASCALACLVAGCASHGDLRVNKNKTDERVCLSGNSHFELKLLEFVTKLNDEGLLMVDANIEVSRASFLYWCVYGDPRLVIEHRFEWLTRDGKKSVSPWRKTFALPGSIVSLNGIATDAKYISFKLEVRLGDSSAKCEARPDSKAKDASGKTEVAPAGDHQGVVPIPTPENKIKAKINAEEHLKAREKNKPAPKTAPANGKSKASGKLTEPFD